MSQASQPLTHTRPDFSAFAAGELHTGFIPEHADDLKAAEAGPELLDRALMAAALGFRDFRDIAFGLPEPHASIGHWRN